MRKYIVGISAGIALCLAGSVFASGDAFQFSQPQQQYHSQKGGFVIGADLGYGELGTSILGTRIHDDGNFAWGAHVGYNFNLDNHPNTLLGYEVGYKDLGKDEYKDEDSSWKIETQAVDTMLTAHYFIWHGLHVFGKAGVVVLGNKETINSNSETDWLIRPEVAVGTGYYFDLGSNMYIDVHAMYDHVVMDDALPTIDAVLGGVSFSFSLT